jgi:hypothetical protein
MSGSLTASELEQLRDLLRRFAEHDLDQWDNWRIETSYGPVFVQLTRELEPGVPAAAFTALTRPEPFATGRFAHASDAAVTSREDVLRVIAEMRHDLAGTGAHEWENPNLEHFLEALQGFLSDLDGYHANAESSYPPNPTEPGRHRPRWRDTLRIRHSPRQESAFGWWA